MHTTGDSSKRGPAFHRVGIVFFWLLLWQGASLVIDNSILFVGPYQTALALAGLLGSSVFWKTLAFSLGRICLGFMSAFLFGVLLGALSIRFRLIRELLSPVLLLFKAIPVASFVILALIWTGAQNLSVFISFMVVLPVIYTSTAAGIKSADPQLLEMAQVFNLPFFRKVRAIYLPALLPHLRSSADSALGLGIKSGVAAEVIGAPEFSIGGELYSAKIYLATADLFAWTFVIILTAWLLERLLRFLLLLADPAKRRTSLKAME